MEERDVIVRQLEPEDAADDDDDDESAPEELEVEEFLAGVPFN